MPGVCTNNKAPSISAPVPCQFGQAMDSGTPRVLIYLGFGSVYGRAYLRRMGFHDNFSGTADGFEPGSLPLARAREELEHTTDAFWTCVVDFLMGRHAAHSGEMGYGRKTAVIFDVVFLGLLDELSRRPIITVGDDGVQDNWGFLW